MKKIFNIKPKSWPKELTFGEFKKHNPNISENILINYYHKYLQEYVENNSRHLEYFDDLKKQISEEIKLLKETRNWDYDGDQTVGPTGGGRKFRSPLEGTKHSIFFDHIDDYARAGLDGPGNEPGDGTLKPFSQLTTAVWFNSPGPNNDQGEPTYNIINCALGGGWKITSYNKE